MTELDELVKKSIAAFRALSPAEQDEIIRQQIMSVALAEARLQKSVYEWVNGVKVYASYEDYCND